MGDGKTNQEILLPRNDITRAEHVAGYLTRTILPKLPGNENIPYHCSRLEIPMPKNGLATLAMNLEADLICEVKPLAFDRIPMQLIWALALFPATYGGVHLLALSISFSSDAEGTMWIAACGIFVGVAFLIPVLNITSAATSKIIESLNLGIWPYL
jgi:hypothetical protein